MDHTFVYIHGGYWQDLNKDISAYCVEPLVNAGIRVVIPGYDLAPKGTYYCPLISFMLELKNNNNEQVDNYSTRSSKV